MPFKDPDKQREAVRKSTAKRRAADPEAARARRRAYYRKNLEHSRAQARGYYAKDPTDARESRYAWRDSNRDKVAETRRRTYRKYRLENIRKAIEYAYCNREVLSVRRRNRWDANKEHEKRLNKQWRTNNPHKVIGYSAKRRARIGSATGVFTREQLQARVDLFGGCCAYCGKPATSIDHAIALARGGSNWSANLRPACKSCNSSKNASDWRKWKVIF